MNYAFVNKNEAGREADTDKVGYNRILKDNAHTKFLVFCSCDIPAIRNSEHPLIAAGVDVKHIVLQQVQFLSSIKNNGSTEVRIVPDRDRLYVCHNLCTLASGTRKWYEEDTGLHPF